MPKGVTHDKFNIFVGSFILGLMVGRQLSFWIILSFLSGHCISTFIFSPDSDFMPKARTGPLQYFLYPYSLFFKHRGISHSLILGTLTRVIYSILMLGGIIYVFNKIGLLDYASTSYFMTLRDFFMDYNLEEFRYLLTTWFFIGLLIADWGHCGLDKISSVWRAVFK